MENYQFKSDIFAESKDYIDGACENYLILLLLDYLVTACGFIFFQMPIIGDNIRLALMPILLLYLIANIKPTHSQKLKVFFFLSFSLVWAADILKVISTNTDNMNLLIMALYGYTAANFFIVLAFLKIRPIKISKAVGPSIAVILGAITIYVLFFMFISKGKIGNYKPPFIIYVSGMFASAALAANILASTSRKKLAISYFLPATALAIFSAVMFSLNKYKINVPRLDFIVLLTYGYAQILYIDGFRKTAR